jgi:hypothetical protein
MRFTRREFVVKMGVLPMGINQLQRRDEVNSPSQLNFCLEAHYRMREDGVKALPLHNFFCSFVARRA